MGTEVKRLLRKLAGAHANCPVEVVPGDKSPVLAGSSWHYTNRSGDYIRHPSAYSRRGWSSLVYRHSTLRVEVGSEWLQNSEISVAD